MMGAHLVRTHGWSALLAAAVFGLFFGTARAAVLFSEDFDDITVDGNNLTTATAGNSFTSAVTTGAGFTAIVRQDSGNSFGAGTSNQYLETVDNATGSIVVRRQSIAGIPVGGVAQFSFSFIDPLGRVNGAPDGDPNSTENSVAVQLDDGASSNVGVSLRISNYAQDAPLEEGLVLYNIPLYGDIFVPIAPKVEGVRHNVAVALNYGASAVNYGGGAFSLATKTFDVWYDGVLVRNDEPFNSPTATKASRILISSSGTAAANFDNVLLLDEITVPEPHCVALAAVGLLVGASRRRRIF
jgi:hypothetical protein